MTPRDKIETPTDFEKFLRRYGFSRREAALVVHHAWRELSAFMAELATKECIGARMLETCILTCARTNEIINMKWSQIDLDKETWTLPAEMMKMDRNHVVPLSRPVMTDRVAPHERFTLSRRSKSTNGIADAICTRASTSKRLIR